MLKDVKCELKQFIFQRVVVIHSVDNLSDPLPLIDEKLIEVKGGSHLHQVDVLDPIIDSTTFDDAVKAAQKLVDELNAEVLTITKLEVDGIKLLVSVGTSVEKISSLTGFSVEAINKVLLT